MYRTAFLPLLMLCCGSRLWSSLQHHFPLYHLDLYSEGLRVAGSMCGEDQFCSQAEEPKELQLTLS